MKVVILAGGFGTRIAEETSVRPKPMVEIGGKPILWHIMKMYSTQGFDEFIICLGYKGYIIKEYFANYFLHSSDVTIDVKNNKMEIHQNHSEPWKITLVDTGELTQTGGRIKRIEKYLDNETFMLTYGDGLSDININKLLNFHKKSNIKHLVGTTSIVHPPPVFGVPEIEGDRVINFIEKPDVESYINGGFYVFEPSIFDFFKRDDSTSLEKDTLPNIATSHRLAAFKHEGFWQCMDTIRHKEYLEDLYKNHRAPWVIWK